MDIERSTRRRMCFRKVFLNAEEEVIKEEPAAKRFDLEENDTASEAMAPFCSLGRSG